jgi:hypothetical protein
MNKKEAILYEIEMHKEFLRQVILKRGRLSPNADYHRKQIKKYEEILKNESL